jgi:hypothetical protein
MSREYYMACQSNQKANHVYLNCSFQSQMPCHAEARREKKWKLASLETNTIRNRCRGYEAMTYPISCSDTFASGVGGSLISS